MAKRSTEPVVLVDGDLQFGDVSVMLGLPPQNTVLDAAAAVQYGDMELVQTLASKDAATGLLVLPAPLEPMPTDALLPGEMVEHLRRAAGDRRPRRRRPAVGVQRLRARAHRGVRRRAARRQHGHPEHQEPEDRDADARPPGDRGPEAQARAEPREREGEARRQGDRAGARPQRELPDPRRHRGADLGERRPSRSSSTSRSRRCRVRSTASPSRCSARPSAPQEGPARK